MGPCHCAASQLLVVLLMSEFHSLLFSPKHALAQFCQPIEVGKRCDPNLHRKWLRFKKKK
jgi:hypothetical protein